MPYKRKTLVAIQPEATEIKQNTAVLESERLLNEVLSNLTEKEQEIIKTETIEFMAARTRAGMSYLAMGNHLQNAQLILEPKGLFIQYLRCLPNIAQATAYRMIYAYQNATKALPTATLHVAMAEGHKLISNEKGGSYSPAYREAVKDVTKRLGPPPDKSVHKAHEWLSEVLLTKRKLARQSEKKEVDPAERLAALEQRVVITYQKALKQLPEDDRRDFAGKVIGMLTTLSAFPVYKVKPVAVPKSFGLAAAA